MSAEVIRLPKRPGVYGRKVAAEIRAEAARKRITGARLAEALDVSGASMSRRMNGHSPISIDELAEIAALLDVPLSDLLPTWAPRGSNPQPTVYGVRHLALAS